MGLSLASCAGGSGDEGNDSFDTSSPDVVNVYSSRHYDVDKKIYDLKPDWDKLEAEAIRGGKAFNAELVARLGN